MAICPFTCEPQYGIDSHNSMYRFSCTGVYDFGDLLVAVAELMELRLTPFRAALNTQAFFGACANLKLFDDDFDGLDQDAALLLYAREFVHAWEAGEDDIEHTMNQIMASEDEEPEAQVRARQVLADRTRPFCFNGLFRLDNLVKVNAVPYRLHLYLTIDLVAGSSSHAHP